MPAIPEKLGAVLALTDIERQRNRQCVGSGFDGGALFGAGAHSIPWIEQFKPEMHKVSCF